MVWWLFWSTLNPAQFPMPVNISNLFPYFVPDEDDSRIRALLVDVDDKQTQLGDLLEQAWETIDDKDRLLMLVCSAARQEDHEIRNMFAHPTISKANATPIVTDGLTRNRGHRDGGVTNILQVRDLLPVPGRFTEGSCPVD